MNRKTVQTQKKSNTARFCAQNDYDEFVNCIVKIPCGYNDDCMDSLGNVKTPLFQMRKHRTKHVCTYYPATPL